MSLPPSALFPNSGISYNSLKTCLYSVDGVISAGAVAIGQILPLDAGTGTAPTGLFVNFGRDVGLKPNRTAPTVGTQPQLGALVNTNSLPVYFSGVIGVVVNGGPFDIGAFNAMVQPAGQDITASVVVGKYETVASEFEVFIPFSYVLQPNDSIYVENSGVQQTNTCGAFLQYVRASEVYGSDNTIQTSYV
jgi:hypothetical protein